MNLPIRNQDLREDLAHWGEAAASARVAEIANRLRYRSLESCLNDE